jgi:hypothetical protein
LRFKASVAPENSTIGTMKRNHGIIPRDACRPSPAWHDGRQSIQVGAPARSREFLPAGMQGVSNRTAGMLSDYALKRVMPFRALLF